MGSAASCPMGGSVDLALMNSDAVILALDSCLVLKVRLHNAQMDYFLHTPNTIHFTTATKHPVL